MKYLSTKRQAGFTLIEVIIYIGLFSIIFTGIFISIYPILTGAERLTKNTTTESEIAFILSKINFTLQDTITESSGVVTTPAAGTSATELVITNSAGGGGEGDEDEDDEGDTLTYRFNLDTTGKFCAVPLVCKQLLLRKNGGAALPLNSSRVRIENFSVKHVAPVGSTPRYLDISFDANGKHVGPTRYYLRF